MLLTLKKKLMKRLKQILRLKKNLNRSKVVYRMLKLMQIIKQKEIILKKLMAKLRKSLIDLYPSSQKGLMFSSVTRIIISLNKMLTQQSILTTVVRNRK